jgi:hypothetical protein
VCVSVCVCVDRDSGCEPQCADTCPGDTADTIVYVFSFLSTAHTADSDEESSEGSSKGSSDEDSDEDSDYTSSV